MKRKIRNIYNLVKYDFKCDFKQSKASKNTKGKKLLSYFGIIALALYLGVLGYNISKSAISGLAKTGLENYFIIAIVLISYVLIFMSSLRTLISNKGKDNSEKYLDKLPISSKERYLAKNISKIFYSFSGIALILTIPLIYYGINQRLGVFYFIRTVIAILLLPVIPSIILFAIMTLIKGILDIITKGKTDNFVAVFNLILTLYFYYLFYYKARAAGNGLSFFINTISNAKKIPLMYLPMTFANVIIGHKVFLNLLIIIASSLLLLIIFTLTIGNLYGVKKGILGKLFEKVSFIKRNNKKEAKEKSNKKDKFNLKKEEFKSRSKASAYIKREFKFFTGNLSLALSTILVPIIVPIFIIAVTGFTAAGEITKIKNNKNEIYLVKETDFKSLSKLKDKENISKEEYQKIIDNIDSYSFQAKTTYEENNDKRKNKEESDLNLSIEVLDNKIKKSSGKEKEELINIRDNLKRLKDNPSNKPGNIILSTFSFDNIDDNKIFNELKNLQSEGKIRRINDNEKKEQLENIKYKNYARYELPTDVINEYLMMKDITTNSLPKIVINKIKDFKDKYKYKSFPKVLQFLIPIILSAFIIYSMQMSIHMFSKDKNEIEFLKTIPISFEKQIKYKQIPGISAELITLIIYLLIPELILNLKMYESIYFYIGLILSFVVITFFNNIEILIDLNKPNFAWKDMTALVKNRGSLFSLFLIKAFMFFLTGFLAYYLVVKQKILSIQMYIVISSSVFLLLAIIVEIILMKKGPKMFQKLSN